MKLLVVFNCNKGTGNSEIDINRFPCSVEDVRKIEGSIMESVGVESVVITNIIKLGAEQIETKEEL